MPIPTLGLMTGTETKWAERVAGWEASGKTVSAFCKGKDFSASGLRYWISRLGKGGPGAEKPEVRLARVVRGARSGAVGETPILIEVGGARLGVQRGFDPETLRAVLEALGVAR
jgi:hypothetical protein